MNKPWTAIVVSVVLVSTSFAQQTKGGYDAAFGVLSDRNMFMRERHKPRPANERRYERPKEDTSPQAIERAFVLRGVAIEDDTLHAYLEDTRTGEAVRVGPGDSLAGGHVAEIAIDAIAYEADGRSAWIEVGQNLSGVRAGPTTEPSASTQPVGPGALLPMGGGSLEERMKQRRLQQRGGK